jgi:Rps23 Pro-64 3,4-dihydroxylase Tpa1-like proline 4-hydroxylase
MVDIQFEELAPGILVYKNVINDFETLIPAINNIEASDKNMSWNAAPSYTNGKSEVLVDHRDTDQIYVPFFEDIQLVTKFSSTSEIVKMSIRLSNSFKTYEDHYTQRFWAVTKRHEGYSILRYGTGQKFNAHVDDHPDFTRRVSTVYYLNEDYTGGEISFNNFGVTYKPKANEMIIFPSSYVYSHAVSPIISGTRYAIVSWLN